MLIASSDLGVHWRAIYGTRCCTTVTNDEFEGSGGALSKARAAVQRAEETTKVISSLDEDYHISRFFHFSNVGGKRFVVSGETATHVAIDQDINTLL
jgi:hypothetical protein